MISKAFFRAADKLGLGRKEIEAILGLSQPTLSRMLKRKSPPPFGQKQEQLALLCIRVYRSLGGLFGQDTEQIQAWFNAENKALNGIPRELIKNIQGLVSVAEYLDAMRGKI